MVAVKIFWERLTLYTGKESERMPWYALPLGILFVFGWLGLDHILTATGF